MGKKYKALSATIWILVSVLFFFGYVIQRGLVEDERYTKLFLPLVICGLFIGIVFVYKCSINIHIKSYAPVIYVVGLIAMVLIHTPAGLVINGSRKWLGWNTFRIVRPAEWLFLATIIVLAYWFDRMNRLSNQSEIDNTLSDWRTTIFRNLETILPIVSILFLIIYDDFIDIILGMIVFAIFVEIVYETNLHRRISKIILWIFISVTTLMFTNYIFIWSRVYFKDTREFQTMRKIEVFQKAGLFGNPIPDADSVIDVSCITIQRVGILGFLLYAVILFILIGIIFCIFRIAKKQDLFGMIITGGIAVHFAINLVLFIISNVGVTFSIIGPIFGIDKSFNNVLYIIEIVMIQIVLKKNSNCLSEKQQ